MSIYDDKLAKTMVLRHFSWSEFVARAEGSTRRSNEKDSWAGASFPKALEMARGDGYKQAIAKAEEIAGHVEHLVDAQLTKNTFQAVYATAGAEVDMGRFLSGEPECMVESEPIVISRHGRAVRIAVPVCYSSNVGKDEILARGAAVMALVGVLRRCQHPLEVWATINIHTTNGENGRLSYMIKVQSADQPVDMGRLMYALAHPSMLRQLGFAAEDGEDETTRKQFGIGYGSYGTAPFGIAESDFTDQVENTIILPALRGRGEWDISQSVEWVKEQLARIFA